MSKLKMKSLSLAGAALLVLCATSAGAATYTLADLDGGSVSSFTSDDGSLTFSGFDVTKIKKMNTDLSLYTVTTTATGFTLTSGEFDAQTGGLKKLDLTYTVTAATGSTIGDATLTVDATRTTGKVKVEKDFEDAGGGDAGTFLLALLTGSTSQLSDTEAFAPDVTSSLIVEEAIRIKKVSTINSIGNEYGTIPVPEPVTLSLLGLGLAGLAWSGRRRTHSA